MGSSNPQSTITNRKSGGWGLRTRLTALLVAALLPLAGLGAFWILRETREERLRVQHEAKMEAEGIADLAARRAAAVREMLATLARLPAVRAGDLSAARLSPGDGRQVSAQAGREEADRLFRDLLAHSSDLENMGLINPDGTVVVSAVVVPPGQRVTVQDRDWFQQALRSGRPAVGGFQIGRITGGPNVILAHPVLDGAGQVTAVITAVLRLAAVSQEVSGEHLRDHLEHEPSVVWAVVDNQGLILLHSQPGTAFGAPWVPSPGMLRAEAVAPGTPWRAVVAIPEAVVAARVRQLLLLIGLPAFSILLLTATLGFWIARNTWRPLQRLAGAVHRIGAGEPGVQVPVDTGGEVGEVATAFADTLAALAAREADLRRRHGEMAALVKANQAIASSLDLEQILQSIVTAAIDLTGARMASLLLVEGERLVWKACAGPLRQAFQQETALTPIPIGKSLSGQVAEHRRSLWVPDVTADSRQVWPDFNARHGLRCYLGVPILAGDHVLGVLNVMGPAGSGVCEERRELIESLASQAAVAIENAHFHSTAVRRGKEVGALLRTTRTVMAGLDLQEMLGRIVGEAAQIAGTPHAKVLLVDRDAQVLRLGAVAGRPSAMLEGLRLPLGTGLSGIVAASGQLLYVPECQHDPRNVYTDQDRELGLVTYLGLPIMIRDEVVGVLTFNTTHPRQYSTDELSYLASFAAQAAIAIQNARLYQEIQQHATTLEARVRERTAELEEALRVKAQFLATMSHELRTPLNHVIGFAKLLQGETAGGLTPKQAQYVDRIYRGGKRLLELVSALLDLSLVEAGKSGLQLEPVPLAPLIQEVLELVRVPVAQKRLEITTALDPELPFIVADRRKLRQILAHLVGNAVKFTPGGGTISVRARRVPREIADSKLEIADWETEKAEGRGQGAVVQSEIANLQSQIPGDFAEIAVEDTGIGIKPEDMERIFWAFELADASDTRKYEGAGIGLAVVRVLVELHGGQVWAESEGPGRGARFIVRLPCLEAPPNKPGVIPEAYRGG